MEKRSQDNTKEKTVMAWSYFKPRGNTREKIGVRYWERDEELN